jgi:secreted trypsin-like serine protease
LLTPTLLWCVHNVYKHTQSTDFVQFDGESSPYYHIAINKNFRFSCTMADIPMGREASKMWWYRLAFVMSLVSTLLTPNLLFAEEQPTVPTPNLLDVPQVIDPVDQIVVPQIVGGIEATPNEFPWQILLTYSGLSASCGGSVIHESWILTAAHCVYGESPSWRTVVAGIHDRTSDAANPYLQRRSVTRIIVHPNYNNSTLDYDIALLELSTPLTLNSQVAPIHLAGTSDVNLYNAGTVFTVSGWGHTSYSGSAAIKLRKVDVPVVLSTTCNSAYGTITNRMFCAGNMASGGVDSCQGDSGGPIFKNDNGVYKLTGIVSSGTGCAWPGYPGIYTHVANLRPWVESIVPITPDIGATATPSRIVSTATKTKTPTATVTRTPTPVSHALVDVASGASFSVGVMLNGGLVAWGYNRDGQSSIPRWLATTRMRDVAVGTNYAVALSRAGRVYVWGANDFQQQQVPLAAQRDVVAISAGMRHVLALRSNGTVVAWGGNNLGQSRVPRTLTNVKAISAGHAHSLALRSDGTVVAWGDNSAGQTRVPTNLRNVVAISAGFDHSLALTASGTVVAWGGNAYGQRTLPRLSSVKAISAGQYFSLALLDNGTVRAWGRNNLGQLNIPSRVTNVVSIAAGYQNSVFGLRNGQVLTLGSSAFGARITRTPTITQTATRTRTPTRTATRTPLPTATATRTPLPLWMTSIPNGDFEDGNSNWDEASIRYPNLITNDVRNSSRSGSWYAWLGGNNNEVSTLSQTVSVPVSASYLRFYYRVSSVDDCGNDYARVSIGGTQVHEINLCGSMSSWTAANVDVTSYRGTNVLLSLDVTTNADLISHFLLDDVGFVANTSDEWYYDRVDDNTSMIAPNQPR